MPFPVFIELINYLELDLDRDRSMEIPFSPTPDLTFCFKYRCHTEIRIRSIHYMQFNLRLVNLKELGNLTPLCMTADVDVFDSDGKLCKRYEKKTCSNIFQMKEIKFDGLSVVNNNYILQYRLHIFNDISQSPVFRHHQSIGIPSCTNDNHKLFINDFESVYETCPFSDIKVIIDEITLSAHKVILAAHSPVFARMLTDDFRESSTNTITITDSSYEVFSLFLKALYSGEIMDKSWSNVRELYMLAEKYDVAVLKRACQQIIPSLLSMDTVCEILIMAFNHDDAALKKAAKDYAIVKLKSIITSDQWKALMESHPHIGYEVTLNYVSSTK